MRLEAEPVLRSGFDESREPAAAHPFSICSTMERRRVTDFLTFLSGAVTD